MSEGPAVPKKERWFRTRLIIPAILVLIAVLTAVETRVVDLGLDLPVSNYILVFSLININALLILLLLFLVVRNLVKLVFERRAKVIGAKLRTKLVLSFITLSLVPAGVLFFLNIQFIGTSLDYWFDIHLDRPLQDAIHVGRIYYRESTGEAADLAERIAGEADLREILISGDRTGLSAYLSRKREEHRLPALRVFGPGMEVLAQDRAPGNGTGPDTGADRKLVRQTLAGGLPQSDIVSSALGDHVSAAVLLRDGQSRTLGVLVLHRPIPKGLNEKLEAIAGGLREYQQLKILKGPIKVSHYIILSLVTSLILFGAIWFGFKLAKGITVPLRKIVQGTQRIAAGDYNFTIRAQTGDEVETLVDSFNLMTRDLKTSKEGLVRANRELTASNRENLRRRNYMEIVLDNIAAGVISVDNAGLIRTINPSAENILGLKSEKVLDRSYTETVAPKQAELLADLARTAQDSAQGGIETHIRLDRNGKTASLLIRMTQLRDEAGRGMGLVVVIEDLTELEKAQRMAAWREVARRIAHEIKNPLTPIKLSAQRLRKRFREEVGERPIFDQAVDTIIGQVDALKALVDEFSSFARMPTADLVRADLVEIINEALALYREAHKDIVFDLVVKTPPPPFFFDRSQIKRVLINLLDNSVAALGEEESEDRGRVAIRVHYLAELKTARFEVTDNGPGLTREARDRLFEPHYSTKRQGTGLGLAIARTIIQDHNGYIRVQDNTPKGTKFIVELPTRGWASELEVEEYVPDNPGR